MVQFDEPTLPAALAGRLTGVTGVTPVHPVDEPVAISLLDECVATVGGDVALHCCAPELPWKLLQRSSFHAVSVDVATLTRGRSGRHRRVRRVGSGGDARRRSRDRSRTSRPSAEEVAAAAASITDRLGFNRVGVAGAHRHHPGLWPRRRHAAVGPHGRRIGAEGRRRHRARPGLCLARLSPSAHRSRGTCEDPLAGSPAREAFDTMRPGGNRGVSTPTRGSGCRTDGRILDDRESQRRCRIRRSRRLQPWAFEGRRGFAPRP